MDAAPSVHLPIPSIWEMEAQTSDLPSQDLSVTAAVIQNSARPNPGCFLSQDPCPWSVETDTRL